LSTKTIIPEITPKEVAEKLKKAENLSIIDVREREELLHGKIKEARNIPLSEFQNRLNEIEKDKEHIFVCRSGNRSGKVAEFLADQGYRVKNMVGGMNEWDK
jgi:rhodanese-related sulfurtransferase